MKPAPFEYQAPATLRETIDLLVSDPEATVIAGGQSLIPVLAFRLAAPSMLVDLRRVPGLGNIAVGESGVRLGARVRWRDIEHDRRLATAHPLLLEAIAHVAHYQIRNRGTVGGSLAHADPAAELPGIAVTCDAEITLVGAAGARTIRAGEFFTGPLCSLVDYLIPTATDFPAIRAIALENHPSPSNPLGVKGAGEGAIIPVGGLIANAVAAALSSVGAEPNELPLSPPRVWRLANPS